MDIVKSQITKLVLPTYSEGRLEEMPMFAENRVHQRTSGNPYPNKVVTTVFRDKKEEVEYTCIVLENKYLKIEILPELGGRIYSALDKTTGYDFFYKQHVIKPALIGCLGSWVSGGVEFNWPFHHRASTFMPVDYEIERSDDGSVIVWLSEHEPTSRMKGMVGICLSPGEAIFETRMKLFNRTPVKQSFLWWENAAVPVNKDYRIFFPEDVNYVNFHYKRSVTTFPIANNALGVFNGIRYDGNVDISYHKNTVQPTSYFSAPSKFDFFGGYDEGRKCGVIHVADHSISPGKKMFTWAYNQLSKTWENALTDTDGAYAELMAGSYSDNQPDFAWIEPYEEKRFSQYWLPFSQMGIPCFANTNGVIKCSERTLYIKSTKSFESAEVIVSDKNGNEVLREICSLSPDEIKCFDMTVGIGMSVVVRTGARCIMRYKKELPAPLGIPETTKDMPDHKKVLSAQELYLCGVHVFQYRDPATSPDSYWKEALKRDPEHMDSLIAMADFCYRKMDFEKAKEYIDRALQVALKFNKHPESGRLFYLKGLIYETVCETEKAYDSFEKAAWNMDFKSAALTRLSALDGKMCDFESMIYHAREAADANSFNSLAKLYLALGYYASERHNEARQILNEILSDDKLYLAAKCVLCELDENDLRTVTESFKTEQAQIAIDIYFDLTTCGFDSIGQKLLKAVENKTAMLYYILGDNEAAKNAPVGKCFPFRIEEFRLLEKLYGENGQKCEDFMVAYLFGCINYANCHYKKAVECFEMCAQLKNDFYIAHRNLAALMYTHFDNRQKAVSLLEKACSLCNKDTRLVFETAYVKNRVCGGENAVEFIEKNMDTMCDETVIELAKAYNLCARHEDAIALLKGHSFVACEGGEHAIADQYMQAHFALGRKAFSEGNFEQALELFTEALTLPQNLGSGLWNECKTVPYRFQQALCYTEMHNHEKAKEIFDWILCLKVDYFSDMHLPELVCYQARVLLMLGKYYEARALIDACSSKWQKALNVEDAGFFGTTPFFNPYIEKPILARQAKFSYLLAHAYSAIGQVHEEYTEKAKEFFDRAKELDSTNIMARIEREYM